MRPLIQALVCVLFLIGVPLGIVQAQDNPPVQELYGSLSPGQTDVFLIENLDKGQNLDIFAENVSGNLDPVVFILAGDTDVPTTLDNYRKAVADLAARSAYPLLELPALRDQYTLAWDDDSGPWASAVLQFNVSEAGDYYMFVSSSLSAAGRSTAGDYRLLVGLDAPQVLDGTAEPTGAVIAVQDQAALATHLIQEYTASLGEDKPQVTIKLSDLNPGETLYVDLRATSGGLKPRLVLRDYSNKPIQVSNLTGQAAEASLLQAFPEGGANYTLDVLAT